MNVQKVETSRQFNAKMPNLDQKKPAFKGLNNFIKNDELIDVLEVKAQKVGRENFDVDEIYKKTQLMIKSLQTLLKNGKANIDLFLDPRAERPIIAMITSNEKAISIASKLEKNIEILNTDAEGLANISFVKKLLERSSKTENKTIEALETRKELTDSLKSKSFAERFKELLPEYNPDANL